MARPFAPIIIKAQPIAGDILLTAVGTSMVVDAIEDIVR